MTQLFPFFFSFGMMQRGVPGWMAWNFRPPPPIVVFLDRLDGWMIAHDGKDASVVVGVVVFERLSVRPSVCRFSVKFWPKSELVYFSERTPSRSIDVSSTTQGRRGFNHIWSRRTRRSGNRKMIASHSFSGPPDHQTHRELTAERQPCSYVRIRTAC